MAIDKLKDLTPLINTVLSRKTQALILLLSQIAAKRNYTVYLVGGTVRDLLLGKESRDLDFAVQPDAISFAEIINTYLKGKLQTFAQFGTARILLPSGKDLDLVTPRREFYAAPGDSPEVEKSDLKNDLHRRDFTINTMACSINLKNFGFLYDFFGGYSDLQQGLIRVLYNLSFIDDPLRIFRAIRFEQRFGFQIEKETYTFLQRAVQEKVVERVSRGKLKAELASLLTEEYPPAILRRLQDIGLFPYLFPALRLSSHNWYLVEKAYRLLLKKKNAGERPIEPLVLYLCSFYFRPGEFDIRSACRNLRLPKKMSKKIIEIMERTPSLLEKLSGDKLSDSELFALLEPLSLEHRSFLEVVGSEKVCSRLQYYHDRLVNIRPFLNGKDLEALGFPPGPIYTEILEAVKKARLNGEILTRKEEEEYVRKYFS
ncbi:MAG: CCA tRNA nucleotidyltransferase [Dethiobacteria bacterium]|nr:CCA tRNA nucleotidyltransferase [Bacillota bacterium]